MEEEEEEEEEEDDDDDFLCHRVLCRSARGIADDDACPCSTRLRLIPVLISGVVLSSLFFFCFFAFRVWICL